MVCLRQHFTPGFFIYYIIIEIGRFYETQGKGTVLESWIWDWYKNLLFGTQRTLELMDLYLNVITQFILFLIFAVISPYIMSISFMALIHLIFLKKHWREYCMAQYPIGSTSSSPICQKLFKRATSQLWKEQKSLTPLWIAINLAAPKISHTHFIQK